MQTGSGGPYRRNIMKIRMQRAGLAGMACLLGACAVGPDYVSPRPGLPAHYAGAGQWVAVSATDPLERGDLVAGIW